jgi:hypothetical protein
MDTQETHGLTDAKEAKLLTTPSNKKTEAKLRLLLEHYAKHGRLLRACEAAGIDHATHYRKLQSEPNYRAAVETVEQQAAQQLEDRVYDMAMEGELQAALVLLRRFRPNLYRERTSLEVSGTINLAQILEAEQRVVRMKERDAGNTAA